MNREHAEQEVVRLADAWVTAELREDTVFMDQDDISKLWAAMYENTNFYRKSHEY